MQFTKTPTVDTNSSKMNQNNYTNSSPYLNDNNWYLMTQQSLPSNGPYIMLTEVNNENGLKLYNFFKNFGIIQDYVKKPQDSSMLLQYKSEESFRRALSYWEKERYNYPNVVLSIIKEEQKNQLFQKVNNYSTQNYQRNQMNYFTHQLLHYIDNKSLKEKFIDVLLNI